MTTKQLLLLLMIAVLGLAIMGQAQTVVTLRPTADGSVKQWTNNAGLACSSNTCFSQVNETSGSTNCASSTHVPGSGVVNKVGNTISQVEQWTLDLTSIPNGAIITAMTVYACEARNGTNNTSGTLRMVLNGSTTACGSSQSVTSTFAELNCAFTGLNTTKSGGTTLEIGNITTQARGIQVDSIDVDVTYHLAQVGGPTASAHFAPAVTILKDHPIASAASIHFDAPCCATIDSPLTASIHFAPAVTGTRSANNVNGSVSISLQTSPGIAIPRSMHAAAAAAFQTSPAVAAIRSGPKVGNVTAATHFDVPCCVTTDSPLAASFHVSPAVNAVRQGNVSASVSTGLSLGTSATVTGVGSIARSAAASTHFDAPCCAITDSPLTASIHFAPTVTGVAHGDTPRGATVGFTTTVTCQACTGESFQATTINVQALAAAQRGALELPSASAHFGVSVAIQQGLNRPVNQSLHVSPSAAELSAHFALLNQGFGTSAVAGVTAPGVKSAAASQNIAFSTSAQESAAVTSGISQSLHVGVTDTASKNITENITATLHFAPTVTRQRDSARNMTQSLHFGVSGGTGGSAFSGGGVVAWHISPSATGGKGATELMSSSVHFAATPSSFKNTNAAVTASVHIAAVPSNAAINIKNVAQSFHVDVQLNIGQHVSRPTAQTLHVAATATGLTRPAGQKAVMIVVD